MKRFTRRTLAAIVGLALGWLVAGMVPGLGTSLAESPAESHGHHASHGDDGHANESDVHDTHGQSGDHGEHDAALDAARLLNPEWGDIGWYPPVLAVAGGLFLAAVVLGVPAMKLRGPEPADPAADHH